MALFNTSRYRNVKNIRKGDTKPDIFSLKGGKLYAPRLNRRIDRLPLTSQEKNYVKEVMVKHDRQGSKGVTREEFIYELERMVQNPDDPITRVEAERIRKYF